MTQGPDFRQRDSLVAFLSALAFSLLGVFAVTALASALPVQLLSPSWQLRLGTSLIDNGPIAALGLLAAWLAALLAPSPARHDSRLASIRRWAIVPALGYLLLLPLLATASWRGVSQAVTAERRDEQRITAKLSSLQQLLRTAPTAGVIEQQWRERGGPKLTPAELALPLPQLQTQLLDRLQQLDNRVQAARRSDARQARIWAVVQNTLRLCLSALFLALGFAAAANGRIGTRSLLHQWQGVWFRSLHRLSSRQRLHHAPGNPQHRFDRDRPRDRRGFVDAADLGPITPPD